MSATIGASVAASIVMLAAIGCHGDDDDLQRGFDDPLPAQAGEEATDYVLVFADEFDGASLDAAKWIARSGDMRHTETLNSASPAMAAVHDGSAFLSAAATPTDPKFSYTGAYVDTQDVFAQTYGKVEFRLRGGYAPGLWYAVWGRPWMSAVPEIDVEFLASDVSQAWFVNHWALPPLPADERRRYVTVDGVDITEFHTYAIVWKPDSVEWRIDDKAYMRVTGQGVPHEPVFWIMNLWVGGWAGPPNPATIFPAHFEVDYFRVYRLRDWATEPALRVTDPRPRYSVGDTIDLALADFDAGAKVEVREGAVLVATLDHPPFRFQPKGLTKAAHQLTFVASDGARRATATANAEIY